MATVKQPWYRGACLVKWDLTEMQFGKNKFKDSTGQTVFKCWPKNQYNRRKEMSFELKFSYKAAASKLTLTLMSRVSGIMIQPDVVSSY
jgi:hypothetical protein